MEQLAPSRPGSRTPRVQNWETTHSVLCCGLGSSITRPKPMHTETRQHHSKGVRRGYPQWLPELPSELTRSGGGALRGVKSGPTKHNGHRPDGVPPSYQSCVETASSRKPSLNHHISYGDNCTEPHASPPCTRSGSQRVSQSNC